MAGARSSARQKTDSMKMKESKAMKAEKNAKSPKIKTSKSAKSKKRTTNVTKVSKVKKEFTSSSSGSSDFSTSNDSLSSSEEETQTKKQNVDVQRPKKSYKHPSLGFKERCFNWLRAHTITRRMNNAWAIVATLVMYLLALGIFVVCVIQYRIISVTGNSTNSTQ